MNNINMSAVNTNVISGQTGNKTKIKGIKVKEPKDSFSQSKSIDKPETYSPQDVKSENKPKVKVSKRLWETVKGTAAGVGMGLAIGAGMVAVTGVLGTALFGVGDFLMDIMMVPHGPGPGMEALKQLAIVGMSMPTAIFGTIGAVAGFKDAGKPKTPKKTDEPKT